LYRKIELIKTIINKSKKNLIMLVRQEAEFSLKAIAKVVI